MASAECATSVVVPVRDGAGTLEACLAALRTELRPGDELIVVDDHSSDRGPQMALTAGATVLHLPPGRRGAAAARNLGAASAQGRRLVFVDADVVIEPGSLARLLAPLEAGQAVAAVGVYAPCAPRLGLASRVKDRSVRHRHLASGVDIAWFWTGYGAIERSVFSHLGGFDAERFGGATVEDMELGYRIADSGGLVLQMTQARAAHLHRFTIVSLARNDFRKSRDWTRTLLRHGVGRMGGHGSTHPREALAMACSLLGLASVPLPPAWPFGAAAWGTLAFCLRRELAEARRDQGWCDATAHLALRGTLYPVTLVGAVSGIFAWLGELG